jgi:hypothetical protein
MAFGARQRALFSMTDLKHLDGAESIKLNAWLSNEDGFRFKMTFDLE